MALVSQISATGFPPARLLAPPCPPGSPAQGGIPAKKTPPFAIFSSEMRTFARKSTVNGKPDLSAPPPRGRPRHHPLPVQQDRQSLLARSRPTTAVVGAGACAGSSCRQFARHVCRLHGPAAQGPPGGVGRPAGTRHPLQPRGLRGRASGGQAGLHPLPPATQVAHRLQRHHRGRTLPSPARHIG